MVAFRTSAEEGYKYCGRAKESNAKPFVYIRMWQPALQCIVFAGFAMAFPIWQPQARDFEFEWQKALGGACAYVYETPLACLHTK